MSSTRFQLGIAGQAQDLMDKGRNCLQKDKAAEIPVPLLPGHHWAHKNIKFSPLLQRGVPALSLQAEEGDQHSVCDTKCWPVPI